MRFAIVNAGKVRHYADRTTPTAAMASMFAAHGLDRSHSFRPMRLDVDPAWLVYPVLDLADGPEIPATEPVAGFVVFEV